MSTSHKAGSAANRRDTGAAPGDQAAASSDVPPQEDMVATTHGQKWAEFYEALDQLVHDQFDRSNELLREAMVLPTVADQEVAAIRRQAAERVAAERHRHGELLLPVAQGAAAAATELTEMHQRMSGLAARLEQLAVSVATAIETINREVPPPDPEDSATVEPEPPHVSALPVVERAVEIAQPPVEAVAGGQNAMSQRLIVHGVRQARLVLSLQRHLYGLDHVEGVETREYQDGTVQLQVRAARPLSLDDLQSWSDGSSLEIERMTSEQIEARLPENPANPGKARSGRWWGSRETAGQSANGVH